MRSEIYIGYILLPTDNKLFQNHLLKRFSFFLWIVLVPVCQNLIVYTCVDLFYSSLPWSIDPFIYEFFFLKIPQCLDYYSFCVCVCVCVCIRTCSDFPSVVRETAGWIMGVMILPVLISVVGRGTGNVKSGFLLFRECEDILALLFFQPWTSLPYHLSEFSSTCLLCYFTVISFTKHSNMPAYLENSAVATGLEKVNFHSKIKERQC